MARASRLDPVNLPSSGTTGYRSIARTLSMMAWVLVLVRSCSILSTTRSPAHPCEDGGHRDLQRVVALRGLSEIFGASSGRQRDGEETTLGCPPSVRARQCVCSGYRVASQWFLDEPQRRERPLLHSAGAAV